MLLGIQLSRNVLTVVAHTVGESVAFWKNSAEVIPPVFRVLQIANG